EVPTHFLFLLYMSVPVFYFDYPSIFFRLPGAGLWWQQSKQGLPDFSHPRHILQLLQWDTKVFPGQSRALFRAPPLPESSSQVQLDKCSRCVVVGNGGILRGLELGPLINQFDTIIRLNSGPLGEFVADVGNRTSIRMAYPESTPHLWADSDPRTLFVAVIYKAVDLNWVSAMIRKAPLWDRLFFWQKVPAQVPIESHRFRLLNPDVIRETALDLLKYPPPRSRLLGWDSNIPTLGVTAVTLASLLCDQVSLAGFGYNLSQLGWPLHYYDHLAMDAILQQKMHNINRESELLRSLVKTGTLSDLTGAIQRLYPS
uniref:Lactosylceramide alpha-2,3-sialyltransferase n=1 Tax=Periophthalmus magnuspinnatus TaxID=409849 RepID=A0A3B4BDK4_9GOBI